MRTPRSRLSKNFSLEQALKDCAQALEQDPSSWQGRWRGWIPTLPADNQDEGSAVAQAHGHEHPSASLDEAPSNKPFKKVILDLGCGKGEYTVACAKLHPDALFIGIDTEILCAIREAERAIQAGVPNVVFTYQDEFGDEVDLTMLFAPGELDGILLNFPTPYPNKKRASLRLTYATRLMTYRTILAPGGTVRLRTDSQPFRDFSLTQLEAAGYTLKWNSDDVRALFPDEPISGYEKKLTARGAVVCGFEAAPGPAPDKIEQTAPLSLFSYLPENIEDMTYIPYGMEGCIANMRGRRANCRKKGLPVWKPPIV